MAEVIFDVKRMWLAIGQFPGQIKTEAVIAGGAIDQRLVMNIARSLAQYPTALTHGDLHMPLRCSRVPRPAAEPQASAVPDLRRDGRRLCAGRGR